MRKDGELDYAHVGTDRIYRNKIIFLTVQFFGLEQ